MGTYIDCIDCIDCMGTYIDCMDAWLLTCDYMPCCTAQSDLAIETTGSPEMAAQALRFMPHLPPHILGEMLEAGEQADRLASQA